VGSRGAPHWRRVCSWRFIPASLVIFTTNNKAAAYADEHGSMEELLCAFEFLKGGADDVYPLLDEIQTEDSSAAGNVAQQQPLAGSIGEQLTKKLPEKGLSNEK